MDETEGGLNVAAVISLLIEAIAKEFRAEYTGAVGGYCRGFLMFDAAAFAGRLMKQGVTVQQWRKADEEQPKDEERAVLAIVNGRPHPNLKLKNAYQIAFYSQTEGWIIEEFPEWEHADVKYWTELPCLPEGLNLEE